MSYTGGGGGGRAHSQAYRATWRAAGGAPADATVDRVAATVLRHVPAAPIGAAGRMARLEEMEIEPSIARARLQADEHAQIYDAWVRGKSAGVRQGRGESALRAPGCREAGRLPRAAASRRVGGAGALRAQREREGRRGRGSRALAGLSRYVAGGGRRTRRLKPTTELLRPFCVTCPPLRLERRGGWPA